MILSGGPASVTRIPYSARAATRLRIGRAGARHLLWRAGDVRAAGRPRRRWPRARIRPRRRSRLPSQSPLFDGIWQLGATRAGLDEPWRRDHRHPAGIPCGRRQREFAVRRHRRRDAPFLRRAVPSRSRAHPARRRAVAQFRPATSPASPPDWNMHAFRAAGRRAHPRAGGKGRVICGLSGGVDSSVAAVLHPRGDRRSAHLHLRRHRIDARGRSRGGASRCSAAITTFRCACRCERIVSLAAGERRQRSREEAQDHRRGLHRRVRYEKRRRSAARISSPRARSIPT